MDEFGVHAARHTGGKLLQPIEADEVVRGPRRTCDALEGPLDLDVFGFGAPFRVYRHPQQDVAEIRYRWQAVGQCRLHTGKGNEVGLHQTDAIIGQRDGKIGRNER